MTTITTTFDLGYLPTDAAARVVKHVHGKTFMNFQVSRGISPCGDRVTIETNYEETEPGDVAGMLLNLMAAALKD